MAVLLAIPVLGGLLVLQSAVISRIPLLQGTADVVLVAVIAWAIQKRVRTAWQWGLIGGAMVGFVSAAPFFATLASYLAVVALAVLLKQRVWQAPILAMYVATFFGSLMAQLIMMVTLRVQGVALPFWEALNLVVLPGVLLNLLLALPFYALLGDMASWLYPETLEM
jgi:hypothetical protein